VGCLSFLPFILTLGFVTSEAHAKLLKGTRSLEQVDPSGYDVLFIAGGQPPMLTMADDKKLHRFIADLYEAGKEVAIVYHATCALLKVRLSDGALLVAGWSPASSNAPARRRQSRSLKPWEGESCVSPS
jgi:putative intracellular protease/amidase